MVGCSTSATRDFVCKRRVRRAARIRRTPPRAGDGVRERLSTDRQRMTAYGCADIRLLTKYSAVALKRRDPARHHITVRPYDCTDQSCRIREVLDHLVPWRGSQHQRELVRYVYSLIEGGRQLLLKKQC